MPEKRLCCSLCERFAGLVVIFNDRHALAFERCGEIPVPFGSGAVRHGDRRKPHAAQCFNVLFALHHVKLGLICRFPQVIKYRLRAAAPDLHLFAVLVRPHEGFAAAFGAVAGLAVQKRPVFVGVVVLRHKFALFLPGLFFLFEGLGKKVGDRDAERPADFLRRAAGVAL